jgi:hypothetical protein
MLRYGRSTVWSAAAQSRGLVAAGLASNRLKEPEKAERLAEPDYYLNQYLPSWGTDVFYKQLAKERKVDEQMRRSNIRRVLFRLRMQIFGRSLSLTSASPISLE